MTRLTTLMGTLGLLLLATSPASADDRSDSPHATPFVFRLVKPTSEAEPTAIRLHRRTGDVWISSKLADAWKQVHDTQQLPEGDYDVKVVAGSSSWHALRTEKLSGRCWWIAEGESPVEIKNRDK
jgi:hypothetical protein